MSSRHFLVTDQYIPDRMMEKIQLKTIRMMEGGLYKFYESLGAHLVASRRIQLRNNDDDDDYDEEEDEDVVPPVIFQQMKPILTTFFIFIALSWVRLFVEIVSFRLERRRNRRIFAYHPRFISRRHTI